MRRVSFIVAVILTMGVMAWAAPFRQGDLVVYRVDDGSTPLTNSGNYAFLDEYATNGTLVQTIPLPTSQFIDANGNVNYPIENSGAATSEGLINLSTDGRYVVFAGYATNNAFSAGSGGANLTTAAGAGVPRVIGTVDSQGNVNTTTAFLNFVTGSGGNPRCAASTDGSNLWICGSTEGIGYTTLGSNAVVILEVANKRSIGIFGQKPLTNSPYPFPPNSQQLYVDNSTSIGTEGTNLPTVVGQNQSSLPPFGSSIADAPPTASPYQFVLMSLVPGNTNVDTMYIADEGSNVAKWCVSPTLTNWVNFGSINTSIGPNALTYPCGTRGITASVTVNGAQTNVNLYIVAGCGNPGGGGGFLYAITDSTGYGGTLTTSQLPTPLASHPLGSLQVFRGVAFAPANNFQVTSVAKSGNDVHLAWNGMAGRSYIVQTNSPGPGDSFNNTTWADMSPTNWEVGTGPAGLSVGIGPIQGSYVDVGGATNVPSRYYRIKTVPEP
jgi:hypothetical protein